MSVIYNYFFPPVEPSMPKFLQRMTSDFQKLSKDKNPNEIIKWLKTYIPCYKRRTDFINAINSTNLIYCLDVKVNHWYEVTFTISLRDKFGSTAKIHRNYC